MINIEKYSAENRQIWDNFIENSKSPMFMFKREFMEYHSDRFTDFSLMFYDEDKLIAIMPASIHGKQVRSHGGLTYGGFFTAKFTKQHHINDCVEALIAFLKKEHICHFIYKFVPFIYFNTPGEECLWPLWKNGAKLEHVDVSTVIDLANPQKMPKGRKAQISRAKREGVVIEKSDDFETFIDLENAVLAELHNTKAVHTAAELKLLQSRFPNNIELWVAKYENRIIAGTVLFVYNNVVHTQYMAANELSREIGGLDYLIKSLMDKYTATKKWFDFGISTEQGGELFNQGLCSQKEGFGGRTISYQIWKINL